MKKLCRVLTLLITIQVIQSCGNFPAYFKPLEGAKIDTGVIDYRYVDPSDGQFSYHFFPEECLKDIPEPVSKEDTNLNNGKGQNSDANNDVKGKGGEGGKDGKDGKDKKGCDQTIYAKNRVRANDSVSINLLYGYICDFPEDANNWAELKQKNEGGHEVTACLSDESGARVKGEVSILATVFELDGEKKISWTQNKAGEDNARVVYYSADVRETGQSLNLSNLPMYGPISYNGKPIFLRLVAVELDQKEVQETGAILRALASLGSKAYPPASPVLGALDKVGSAFLETQQDDLFWQYEMMFNGDRGIAPVTAPLSAGIMSFVRVQNRDQRFDWKKYCLDKTTGRIREPVTLQCESTCDEGKEKFFTKINNTCDSSLPELKGHTYFTIQVTRNEPALSQDAFQTFAELNTLSEEDAVLPESLQQYFTQAEVKIEKTARFDRARSLSIDLNSSSQVKREKAREAFTNALCLGFKAGKDDNPASFEEGKRLSKDKRYKLLELLEQSWAKEKENVSKYDASPFFGGDEGLALCADSDHDGWKTIYQPANASK